MNGLWITVSYTNKGQSRQGQEGVKVLISAKHCID